MSTSLQRKLCSETSLHYHNVITTRQQHSELSHSAIVVVWLQVLGDSGEMDALKSSMEEKFMANNPSKVT